MGEQSYVLHCKIEVASGAIAREFDLGRYQRQYKIVAAREREDSGRVIWRLRHMDPDFTLGSLECVTGRGDTTRLIVEDPPITIWKPTALEEVDGDFDRLAEATERRIREAEARDVAHRSIQVRLVEDLLHTLEADYDIPVSSPAAEAAFAGRWLAELPASSDPSTRAGQGDLTMVNLSSTAGTMSPGLYPAKPGQAKAIELANAAISNLKYQFGATAADVTAGSPIDMQSVFDELRAALLALGYSSVRVERALGELLREEEERVERSKPVTESGETQYLVGAYIEPTTEVYGGRVKRESPEAVMDHLIPRLVALVESDSSVRAEVISRLRPLFGVGVPKLPLPRLSRKAPGRKPDPENETAYQMVLDGGGTEEASDNAYAWWCRAKNIQKPTRKDRDNFNQAMKRAAERLGRGQSSAE